MGWVADLLEGAMKYQREALASSTSFFTAATVALMSPSLFLSSASRRSITFLTSTPSREGSPNSCSTFFITIVYLLP